ncbi:tRNA (guanosine(46)-N7)-methyltransferase TrmB [Parapedobacter lycopersici]|uniref:tRNA (guanosine(46)-N7)-methyltransferase TrmB n=1 Tax=Parapedobacter lycopersici TaxID=1864939 RepID=UPI00214D54A9|nr:tRNA (guanosine(46)-N7)-methyltransferase TrmB [Parapedobacter lycopersici]
MGKDKLRKFAEINSFSNVFQLDEGRELKGRWASGYFGNANPLVLELACGKGEYTVNMAKLFPEKNFIGVDYKGNRIWRGAKTALEEHIPNVAFLRIQIETLLDYFDRGEVHEIWITFPDPQPQQSREKKRLTAPSFLARYQQVLRPGANMHLKTDNDGLHAYTLEKLTELGLEPLVQTTDLYRSDFVDEVLAIKTYYERKYLVSDKNINYLKWRFAGGNEVTSSETQKTQPV